MLTLDEVLKVVEQASKERYVLRQRFFFSSLEKSNQNTEDVKAELERREKCIVFLQTAIEAIKDAKRCES